MKNGEFVIPGDELGTCEEFIPGEGTYEEEGKIYSSVTGIVNIDLKERKITVVPKTSTPPLLRKGSIIIGKVLDVKPQIALVDIVKLKGVERSIAIGAIGSIHISQTRSSFVDDLTREFKVDDIVCAKVINPTTLPVFLSTKDQNLGVIRAFCEICNVPLIRMNNKLKCPECGRIETRKISSEYGKGLI